MTYPLIYTWIEVCFIASALCFLLGYIVDFVRSIAMIVIELWNIFIKKYIYLLDVCGLLKTFKPKGQPIDLVFFVKSLSSSSFSSSG